MHNTPQVLGELVRASSLLTAETNFQKLISVLVEQSLDITHSDAAGLYLYSVEDRSEDLKLAYRRGRADLPASIERNSELVEFIDECDEAVVLLSWATAQYCTSSPGASPRAGGLKSYVTTVCPNWPSGTSQRVVSSNSVRPTMARRLTLVRP